MIRIFPFGFDLVRSSSVLIYEAGPSDPILTQYLIPVGSNYSWECTIQKYRNSDYVSFSIVGLGLIFSVGGAIILATSFTIFFMLTVWKKTEHGDIRNYQWEALHVLNLQRDVLDKRGDGGGWTTEGWLEIPRTVTDTKFVAFTDDPNVDDAAQLCLVPAAVATSLQANSSGWVNNGGSGAVEVHQVSGSFLTLGQNAPVSQFLSASDTSYSSLHPSPTQVTGNSGA